MYIYILYMCKLYGLYTVDNLMLSDHCCCLLMCWGFILALLICFWEHLKLALFTFTKNCYIKHMASTYCISTCICILCYWKLLYSFNITLSVAHFYISLFLYREWNIFMLKEYLMEHLVPV